MCYAKDTIQTQGRVNGRCLHRGGPDQHVIDIARRRRAWSVRDLDVIPRAGPVQGLNVRDGKTC